MKYQDYYQILGVPKNADAKAIKNAFRRLARQYHPDANKGDPQAETRFKAINEAHTVLSDPEKRKKYDRFGKDWERFERAGGHPQDFDWNQWGMGGRQRRMSQEEFARMMGGRGGLGGQGFSNFFEQLFGTGSMGGFGPQAAPRAAPPKRFVETEVTLEEAFRGTSRIISTANGQRVQAKIPPGVKTDARIRLRGSGSPQEGDLYIKVTVAPHPTFAVQGEDLHVKVTVDLYTAVLGGEVAVPTLEGSKHLKIAPGTQSHAKIALSGQGMPHLKQPRQRGNLIVLTDVRIPKQLSEQEKTLFKQLRSFAA